MLSMMFKLAFLLGLVAAVAATPGFVRSRAEVEQFRRYLESTRIEDGKFLARVANSPLANPEENSGKYQGDILLDDHDIEVMVQQYATGRNAYTVEETKWPDNTVIWEFGEGEFNELQQEAILEGIRDIETQTCVRFRYRQPEDVAYVTLTGGSGGCYANVGYRRDRGQHVLNLQRNEPGVSCFRHATIIHEWLHILGFFHMQSTHNRDEYVRIAHENLTPGTEHNFEIYASSIVDNLGTEYDYVSCLHYTAYAFSSNGEKTIIALQEHEGEMGQRIYITDKDWLKLNRHYNCPGAWAKVNQKQLA